MKTALYVATVARTYRKAIDDFMESPEIYKQNMPWYLSQVFHIQIVNMDTHTVLMGIGAHICHIFFLFQINTPPLFCVK